MAEEKSEGFIEMSRYDKVQFVRALSVVFAITVLVFTRRRLGFRLISQNWLLVMMIVMMVLTGVFQDFAGPRASLLAVYALAMFGMGMYQRWRRWQELCSGVRWHTYSHGISWLEHLTWPAVIRSHYRLTRFVEPLVVMSVGLLIGLLVSRALGVWLVWSGIFLFLFEGDWYEHNLANQLNTLDGLVNAEVQEENVRHFQQPQPEQKQRTLEETAGIATGLAPDIEKQVALRKAKRRAAPDNLVSEPSATSA